MYSSALDTQPSGGGKNLSGGTKCDGNFHFLHESPGWLLGSL